MNRKKRLLILLLISAASSTPVFAGNYTTGISPSGTEVVSPITATFNIQDFGQKDYDIDGFCATGFVPAEMQFSYWTRGSDGADVNVAITPAAIPTSAMIASGIYSAAFNLPVGQVVYSIGANFSQYTSGGGTKCVFNGNQPAGAPLEDWSAPIFTVIAPPTPAPIVVDRRFINNTPSVVFNSISREKVWRGEKTVSYYAVDYDPVPGGLRNKPIDVYYSDNNGMNWKDLERDKENGGAYVFNSAKLPDGDDYKIKITATDNFGVIAAAISDSFAIDNTGPNFKIIVSPATAIKETDKIALAISASEDLKQAPEVRITQRGSESQKLVVSGSYRSFSASYTVLKGFSGEAIVSVKGADLTGNAGETVTSGKTFFVGRFGPPPPIVDNIADGQILSAPNINVSGKAEEAAEVILILNGKTELRIKPDRNGAFVFQNVSLSDANKGRNVLSISSIDKNGVPSVEGSYALKLNKPPEISLSLVLGGTISGKKEIKWIASDLNGDDLSYALEYSVDGGNNWDALVSGLIETSYELDTAALFDGSDYRLKAIVSDGADTAEAVSEKFAVLNNSSFSLSGIPGNNLLTAASPVFDGLAAIARGKIASIKYSLDKEKWEDVAASDGRIDSAREEFRVKFGSPLIDGKYNIAFEIKDDRGDLIRAFRTFIIDTAPPIAPVVTFPAGSDAINAGKDLDPSLNGLQINILGKSEAGAALTIMVNNRRYQTAGTSKGEFIFKNVTLFSRGVNRYFLSSADVAGNVTKSDGFIISNSVPVFSAVVPKTGDFIGRAAEIGWEVNDSDNDPIVSQIFYRKKGGDWLPLANDLAVTNFEWNTSRLNNGEYELRIVANDGLSDASMEVAKIFIDNTAPQVSISGKNKILTNNPRIILDGVAADKLSGIQYVEYSFDGDSWYKAMITEGYEAAKAKFEFYRRGSLEDGNYKVRVRATDRAGNIAYADPVELIIDTSPPRIGSSLISSGALTLFPENDGFVYILKNKPYKLLLAVSADARNADLSARGAMIKLDLNRSTSLWEGEFSFKDAGEYFLEIYTEDEVGNAQTRALPKLKVVDGGNVYNERNNERIANAEATVYVLDARDNSWLIWDGRAFGQQNPQATDDAGQYGFLVPAGRYRLEIAKSGFEGAKSGELEIKNNTLINLSISLTPTRGMIRKIMEYFL